MDEFKFKVIQDGVEVEAEILFTFQNDETNKDYIVYTLNELDDNGNIKIYASEMVICDDGSNNVTLKDISDEEYFLVESLLNDLTENARKGTLDEYLYGE